MIDNRAGAGGSIGTDIVMRANADGYTILVGASSYASNAALYKLMYDPIAGISPVTLITRGPFVIAIHPSVKANNVKELIALARAKPGSLTFGSSGTGSVPHLATEHFRQMADINIDHAPYKGDGPAIIELLGGQIQIYFGGPLVLSPHIKAGKLRGLAVTSEQRAAALPDLPAERNHSRLYRFYVVRPVGAPRHFQSALAQLNQAIGRILKRPDVEEQLRNGAMESGHNSPEAFSRFVAQDIEKWQKVVKAGNIRID